MTELNGEWLTYPAESVDNDKTIIVTIRTDVEKFRKDSHFIYRVTVGLPYAGDAKGMPDEKDSAIIEQVTEAFDVTFKKDPIGVMTEISTGDDRREWVLQTRSLGIFNKKINEALASLPLLPLEFDAEEDPDWELYTEALPTE